MPFKPTKRTRTERISTEELGDGGSTTRREERYRAGSIEQQLDMCESGPLRGEEILRSHGARERKNPYPTLHDEQLRTNYRVDMSEEGREGMEESGDEHSAGLQGEESQELGLETGIPGEMTEKVARRDPTRRGYRRRAA